MQVKILHLAVTHYSESSMEIEKTPPPPLIQHGGPDSPSWTWLNSPSDENIFLPPTPGPQTVIENETDSRSRPEALSIGSRRSVRNADQTRFYDT